MKKRAVILGCIFSASILLSGSHILSLLNDTAKKETKTVSTYQTASQEEAETDSNDSEKEDSSKSSKEQSILDQATIMYQQYNYDEAIKLLKGQKEFVSNKDYMDLAAKCQISKSSLVEYPLEKITHVFFHTLIKDSSKAFDGDSKSGGYNQVMTTISEFNKIIQILYDKGYVLVSPHDMATVNKDGTMSRGKIMVPEGKIPFVLSQDDVSYYHYMDGDGYASRLVLDENGDVKTEYIEDDGSVSVGDYDMVPLLDDQKAFLDSHPDFDYDQDVKDAKKVADAMKAEGWEFASHTWGHRNATTSTAEELKTDDKKWKAYVAPILGDTDMVIFAFGADIGDWEGYSSDNAKFAYYKKAGYDYFCNVDSSQYFVQITDQYFRQGRRNLDGYRMYYNPDMLSDLFDVSEVWDSSRPTPVPEM